MAEIVLNRTIFEEQNENIMSPKKSHKITIGNLTLIIFVVIICNVTFSAAQGQRPVSATLTLDRFAEAELKNISDVAKNNLRQCTIIFSRHMESKRHAPFISRRTVISNGRLNDSMLDIHQINAMQLNFKSLDANMLTPIESRLLQIGNISNVI
jgi:hypothetical protein